jgi:hypothetical protein
VQLGVWGAGEGKHFVQQHNHRVIRVCSWYLGVSGGGGGGRTASVLSHWGICNTSTGWHSVQRQCRCVRGWDGVRVSSLVPKIQGKLSTQWIVCLWGEGIMSSTVVQGWG